jgi:enoyl-CoA hydratase
MSTVLVERGPVTVVTLNRPDVRNAISRELVNDLRAALVGIASDKEVRAVVLHGAGGKAFASGADIAELVTRRAPDAFLAINAGLFNELEQCPVPTLAAIDGYCLGGGLELALACDIRVAGRSSKLGQPEVGLGIIPGAGAPHRLPRLVGIGRARELIFTGRLLDATEAERIGLVEQVVDDGQALAAGKAMAEQIAKNAPLAVRMSKLALNQAAGALDPGTWTEILAQALCFEDPEKSERMQAFLAKRRK